MYRKIPILAKSLMIILFCPFLAISLSAKADDTAQTDQLSDPAQAVDYSVIPPYPQQYNSQDYYRNPYQVQYPRPYINPYLNSSPFYGGINPLPSSLLNPVMLGTGSTGAASQIIKSIGRSLMYSMIRGY